MQFRTEEIRQVVASIWETVLGMEVETWNSVDPTAPGNSAWIARVEITGAWRGSVSLLCSDESARRAAARMFCASPSAVTPDQICDAIGELSNVTGGNVKALVPPKCSLSLPAVATGGVRIHEMDGRILVHERFRCQNLPFQIVISSREPPIGPGSS